MPPPGRVPTQTIDRPAETETAPAGDLSPRAPVAVGAPPTLDTSQARERIVLAGEVSGPSGSSKGCPFAGRCPHAIERCREEVPLLQPGEVPGQQVACHRWSEIPLVRGISA